MIELSKNYVALNMAKFIYEEEVKAGKTFTQDNVKQHIFDLYEECVIVVEENDAVDYGFEEYDFDDDEGEYIEEEIAPR